MTLAWPFTAVILVWAAGVETLIEAFGCTDPALNLYLLVAGDGSRLAACQALAGELNTGCIFFHSPWHTDETSSVLAAADILVLPTRGEQSLVSVPSKLISYMLAARPIVAQAVARSDLSHIVSEADCGWIVEPGSGALLAAALHAAAQTNVGERQAMGNRGRSYALRHMTTEANLPRVISLLENSAAVRSAYATSHTPDGTA